MWQTDRGLTSRTRGSAMSRLSPVSLRIGRRELFRLLGASAGSAALVEWGNAVLRMSASPLQTRSASKSPPRAIVRTVLGDVDPSDWSSAILMHEHLGSGMLDPDGPDHEVTNPTQDAAWMTEELTAARKAGIGCIVAAETVLPAAERLAYLTRLARSTGLHIVAAGAY